MKIKPLIWDSDFFKLKIGVISLGEFNMPDFINQKSHFDLIYIFESPDDNRMNSQIQSTGAYLVDIKQTYKKKTEGNITIDDQIVEYSSAFPNENLVRLALQSGIYSRFKTDTHFPLHSYEKLYAEWIRKSCDKEIAFKVLVYGDEKNPGGFITVASKNKEAQIGLIAVDESTRGKGIGKKLIHAAEYTAKNHTFDFINVVTQAANKSACNLYEKCGFVLNEAVNIYHFWNK